MVRLDNDAFLTELNKLYLKNKESGSVWITFKKYEEKKEKEAKEKKGSGAVKKPKAESVEGSENKCLLRATDGKKIKISTLVSAKDLVRFQMAFSNVLKVQMDNLKRKEKKKKPRKVVT